MIVQRPLCKQNLCLDKGYDFLEIEKEKLSKGNTFRIYVTEVRRTIDKAKIFSKRRWLAERTNSWHNNRFRKLLLRYEKKSENYLALVCLACCIIVYRG
jgi:putative transposase